MTSITDMIAAAGLERRRRALHQAASRAALAAHSLDADAVTADGLIAAARALARAQAASLAAREGVVLTPAEADMVATVEIAGGGVLLTIAAMLPALPPGGVDPAHAPALPAPLEEMSPEQRLAALAALADLPSAPLTTPPELRAAAQAMVAAAGALSATLSV